MKFVNQTLSGLRPESRIAVVGGGPAGISAAYFLKKRGYSNVEVFEKEECAGGKVRTFYYEGRAYELGALWLAKEYKTVLGLAREFGIKTQAFRLKKYVITNSGERVELLKYTSQKWGFSNLVFSFIRAWRLLHRHNYLRKPGFAGVDSALYKPAHEILKHPKIAPVSTPLEIFLSGSGYGYFSETPSIYILKGLEMLLHVGFRYALKAFTGIGPAPLRIIGSGFQELWDKISDTLKVQFNSEVLSIERKAEKVQVRIRNIAQGDSSETVREFDFLVLATPPGITRNILDCSEEERSLLEQPRTCDYVATIFRCDGLKSFETNFFEENISPDRIGRVLGYGGAYENVNVFSCYQQATPDQTDKSLISFFEEDLASAGARNIEILARRRWSYFPHLRSESLKGQFYEKFEALQGQNRTVHVGGLLSFETVEHACTYTENIVNTHFGRLQ